MARKGTKVRRASKKNADQPETPDITDEVLAAHDLAVGEEVQVEGDGHVYTIRKANPDGSVEVVGPFGFRSFMPEWLFPAERVNRRGRKVAVKSCPKDKKGLRDRWREEHGLYIQTAEAAS